MPAKAWVVLGLFLAAAILMALHTALSGKDSALRLKVQHSFRSAQLSVWVDGSLSYSGRLTGSPRKRFGLIPDSVQGTLTQTVAVSSGAHQVRVRVESEEGINNEESISGEFSPNSQRVLAINARRSDVSLNWQGSAADDGAPGASSPGWISRYAGALLATIAGSIISALTGFALKELPGHIRARQQNATPKI